MRALMEVWTVQKLLNWITDYFTKAGIPDVKLLLQMPPQARVYQHLSQLSTQLACDIYRSIKFKFNQKNCD